MIYTSLELKKSYFAAILLTLVLPLVFIVINDIEVILGLFFFILLFFIVYILSKNFSTKYGCYHLVYILCFAFFFRASIAFVTSIIYELDPAYMPDAQMYHMQMTNIANSFFEYTKPILRMHSLGVIIYSYIGAIFYFIFGSSMLLMKLFNSFIGMLLVINVYRISFLIFGKRTALIASVLVVIWPSIAFWASQNLRDSLMVLSISQVIYFFVKGRLYQRKRYFYLIIFPLIACILLRYYIGIIISILLIVILIFQLSKVNNFLRVFSYLILIVILGFVVKIIIDFIPSIVTLFNIKRNYLATGGSAFLTHIQYNNLGEMLLFMPIGLFYFLFSPFPGMNENVMQTFSALENIIFYVIFICAIGGVYQIIKNKKFPLTFFLCSIILFISLFYSVIEANMGTAYRHKMQILPFIIIFASYYLSKIKIVRNHEHEKT